MSFLQLFCCLLTFQAIYPEGHALQNDRPIIGVLAEEFYPHKTEGGPDGTYIAASYVKMVEASGARVVPIMTGQDRLYYKKIVESVNGILLPGGGLDLWAKGGYGEATQILYDLVLETNRQGKHFPLFGVCLGMEALAAVSADMSKDILTKVEGVDNIPLQLDFLPNAKSSGLYSKMPQQFIELLKTKNITANHHSNSFTRESIRIHHLEQIWRPLTTNKDAKGVEFISTMEHIEFPQIFGTQFHPEKIVFEWSIKHNDPHSPEAILVNRYFYDHFVEHARRNGNAFHDKKEEESSLIYNFPPVFTPTGYFEQIYRFNASAPADYLVNQVDGNISG